MLMGIGAILLSIILVVGTEIVRRNPAMFRTGFMVGHRRSFVLLWYFPGRPEQAREALATDENLRRKYLIEKYILVVVLFASGIGLILLNH